jgi:hypothetical protein
MNNNLGFIIVPLKYFIYPSENNVTGYRGVDRYPFTSMELAPLPEDFSNMNKKELHLREIISKEMEKDENNYSFIISNEKAFLYFNKIKKIYSNIELLFCFQQFINTYSEESDHDDLNIKSEQFKLLGYDVANKGENFFSVIRHNLLGKYMNENKRYLDDLNDNKLFTSSKLASEYLLNYINRLNAEKGNFIVYKLYSWIKPNIS